MRDCRLGLHTGRIQIIRYAKNVLAKTVLNGIQESCARFSFPFSFHLLFSQTCLFIMFFSVIFLRCVSKL